MDAQKRTILAFVLIALVLFVWSLLTQRGAQKGGIPSVEPPEVSQPEKEVAERRPPTPEVVQVPEGVEERGTVVETDRYRLELTNLGIRSLQLKDYEGLGGGWIEEVEELKKLSKGERIGALDGLGKELKNGYKGLADEEIEGWSLSIDSLVKEVRKACLGLGGELGERVGRLQALPSWLAKNNRGWIELVPYGERVLSLDLPGIDLGNCPFRIERNSIADGERVSLVYLLPAGDSLTREFTFQNGSYQFRIGLSGREFDSFNINWGGGLAVTEQNRKDDLGYASAVVSLGGEFRKENLAGLKKKREEVWRTEGRVDWVGVRTKYFLACLIPEDPMKTEGFEASLLPPVPATSEERAGFGCVPGMGKVEEGRISVALRTRERGLSVYVGPLDYDTLKSMGIGLERVVDLGWAWISPISRGILALFKTIHRVIPNYGVIIITFSCLMMVVFFPLTRRSLHQMQEMQKLQPKMEALRKKFKNEPQKINVEMMKLYKQHKVNPFGGCLPLIFQMPVFFALFSVLRSTIELRRAGFLLWIDDLSTPDTVCNIPLPQGGDFALHTLPILMLVSMIVQQRLTTMDPRQKTMAYLMPIMFTFIFWNLPAGLVLYWLSYNVLSIIQQWVIRRREREGKGA